MVINRMKRPVLFALMAGMYMQTYGQNTTNSPVSMFGLGEIITGESGKYSGMSGVGIGMRSGNFLNNANPAGLAGIDSMRIVYELGGMAALKSYEQSGLKNNSVVGNVTNIGLGARVLSRWYLAAGLTPLSSVNYLAALEQEIEGGNGVTATSTFEGSGGLYRVYLRNAFRLNKHFSIGANVSYVLGEVTYNETQSSAAVQETSSMRAFYADFGMQYVKELTKYTKLTVGGVYGYRQKLNQDNTYTVSSSSSTSGDITKDLHSTKKYLPQFWGAGASLGGRRWTYAVDYKLMQWSKMERDYSTIRYVDQHRVNIGAELLTGDIWTNPWHWMVGASLSNSYVVVKNKHSLNYSFSAGIGVPILQGSLFSAGVRYDGQKVKSSMQKERSLSLYINLSFSEKTYRGRIQ